MAVGKPVDLVLFEVIKERIPAVIQQEVPFLRRNRHNVEQLDHAFLIVELLSAFCGQARKQEEMSATAEDWNLPRLANDFPGVDFSPMFEWVLGDVGQLPRQV
jgi:hypothetical protein